MTSEQVDPQDARREIVLIPSDRARALERLTRRLAHDLRNPISAIRHFTEDIGAAAEPGSDLAHDVRLIGLAVDEALGHLSALRALVIREPTDPVDVALTDIATRAVADARADAPDAIEIEIHTAADTPEVRADRDALALVVTSVLRNAIDALDGAGSVRVAVRADADGAAEIVTEDTGRGMQLEEIGRSIEPFYSTAPDAHGRGLGLSQAAAVINGLGGRLTIASTPGEGTRVRVVLPPAP